MTESVTLAEVVEQACEVMHDATDQAVSWADVPADEQAAARRGVRALFAWLDDEHAAAYRDR